MEFGLVFEVQAPYPWDKRIGIGQWVVNKQVGQVKHEQTMGSIHPNG